MNSHMKKWTNLALHVKSDMSGVICKAWCVNSDMQKGVWKEWCVKRDVLGVARKLISRVYVLDKWFGFGCDHLLHFMTRGGNK